MNKLDIQIQPELLHQDRLPCPQCTSSYRLYCPICILPIGHQPPSISLPVQLTLIKHPRELKGKSTAIHAKLVCPEDVTLIEDDLKESYTGGLDYDPSRTLLLFPSSVGIFYSFISVVLQFKTLE